MKALRRTGPWWVIASNAPRVSYVSRPCRHGLCSQLRQMSWLTAVIWVGATVESAKLKLPSGQTYLQKGPAGNRRSEERRVGKEGRAEGGGERRDIRGRAA